MNTREARTFTHKSESSYQQVKSQLSCDCEPYEDVFTYGRWKALGQQVQKGERSIKLQTWIPIVDKDENGDPVTTGVRPKTASLFCRCQTRPETIVDHPDELVKEAEIAEDIKASAIVFRRLAYYAGNGETQEDASVPPPTTDGIRSMKVTLADGTVYEGAAAEAWVDGQKQYRGVPKPTMPAHLRKNYSAKNPNGGRKCRLVTARAFR